MAQALEGDTMWSRGEHQCVGIWRPPEKGSSLAPTALMSISNGATPSARQSARSR